MRIIVTVGELPVDIGGEARVVVEQRRAPERPRSTPGTRSSRTPRSECPSRPPCRAGRSVPDRRSPRTPELYPHRDRQRHHGARGSTADTALAPSRGKHGDAASLVPAGSSSELQRVVLMPRRARCSSAASASAVPIPRRGATASAETSIPPVSAPPRTTRGSRCSRGSRRSPRTRARPTSAWSKIVVRMCLVLRRHDALGHARWRTAAALGMSSSVPGLSIAAYRRIGDGRDRAQARSQVLFGQVRISAEGRG